jgi:hypothetical protein
MRLLRHAYFAVAVAGLAMTPGAPAQLAAIKLAAPGGKTEAAAPDPVKRDQQALKSAGLKADDPAGLLGYLRQRTLSDSDLTKIQGVIRRMGDEDFEARIRATAEVEKFGPAAISPLRNASQADADPEVAYRAGETLQKMETVSHTDVAMAAVRALAKSKPADAAKVLLGYLPVADTMAVEDEIRRALVSMAVRDGKPEPALLAALKDTSPLRRGAAAVALVEGGPAGKPVHIPEAYAEVKAALKAETDPEAKFRTVYAMLTTARDDDAVADLVGLIPLVQRGRLWQIEDYLVQLAGNPPPKVKLATSKESLEKGRDEWLKWWNGAKAAKKLAAFEYKPKTTGRLLLVSMDARGWGNGKIAELGPDLKERWKLRKLNAPLDGRVLSNGRVLVLEQHYRISEWDPQHPEPLVQRNLQGNQAVGLQVLPNGNVLVAYRHMVVEHDKDWKQVNTYTRNQNDILAAQKLTNGQVLVLCQQNPGLIVRLDDKWKELPNPVRIGNPFYQPRMEVLSDDRVLITEQTAVVEYDLKATDKKQVWKFSCNSPSSAQRLPNGNTLIVESNSNQVKEVTPEGEVAWAFTPNDGMRVMRAERR